MAPHRAFHFLVCLAALLIASCVVEHKKKATTMVGQCGGRPFMYMYVCTHAYLDSCCRWRTAHVHWVHLMQRVHVGYILRVCVCACGLRCSARLCGVMLRMHTCGCMHARAMHGRVCNRRCAHAGARKRACARVCTGACTASHAQPRKCAHAHARARKRARVHAQVRVCARAHMQTRA